MDLTLIGRTLHFMIVSIPHGSINIDIKIYEGYALMRFSNMQIAKLYALHNKWDDSVHLDIKVSLVRMIQVPNYLNNDFSDSSNITGEMNYIINLEDFCHLQQMKQKD